MKNPLGKSMSILKIKGYSMLPPVKFLTMGNTKISNFYQSGVYAMGKHVQRVHLAMFVSFIGFLLWSMVNPYHWKTWLFESTPVIIGAVIIVVTYHRFRLSTVVYLLLWLDAIIMLIGGHYSYARMPLFDWLKDHYHLVRNNYDRVGHFFQGVTPAIFFRELLLRKTPLQKGRFLTLTALCFAFALSAGYELIEWWATLLTHGSYDSILETQKDHWDTQWDMFMALLGGFIALMILRRVHDRSMRKLKE